MSGVTAAKERTKRHAASVPNNEKALLPFQPTKRAKEQGMLTIFLIKRAEITHYSNNTLNM